MRLRAIGSFTTAMGYYSEATGRYAIAFGNYALAKSGYEMVIGRYNTDYTPTDALGWDNSDRLFVVGNGTSSSARSNALTITKDGKMNINDAYDMPTADGTANYVMSTDGSGTVSFVDANSLVTPAAFTTSAGVTSNAPGIYATDDFVFGSPQLDNNGNLDNRRRLFFDKSKAAFRSGYVASTQWDASNIGDYSIAMGNGTIASGSSSVSLGGVRQPLVQVQFLLECLLLLRRLFSGIG